MANEQILREWLATARKRLEPPYYKSFTSTLRQLHIQNMGDVSRSDEYVSVLNRIAELLWLAKFPEGHRAHTKWLLEFCALPPQLLKLWPRVACSHSPAPISPGGIETTELYSAAEGQGQSDACCNLDIEAARSPNGSPTVGPENLAGAAAGTESDEQAPAPADIAVEPTGMTDVRIVGPAVDSEQLVGTTRFKRMRTPVNADVESAQLTQSSLVDPGGLKHSTGAMGVETDEAVRSNLKRQRVAVRTPSPKAALATGAEKREAMHTSPKRQQGAAVRMPSPKVALCVMCQQVPSKPKVAVLCGHFACSDCWDSWLAQKQECPVCRQKARHANLILLRGWGDD